MKQLIDMRLPIKIIRQLNIPARFFFFLYLILYCSDIGKCTTNSFINYIRFQLFSHKYEL